MDFCVKYPHRSSKRMLYAIIHTILNICVVLSKCSSEFRQANLSRGKTPAQSVCVCVCPGRMLDFHVDVVYVFQSIVIALLCRFTK